jgi:hypothetical protein
MKVINRETGYYWVLEHNNETWVIAWFDSISKTWVMRGVVWQELHFNKIDELKITKP